jgi:hypothetical protein
MERREIGCPGLTGAMNPLYNLNIG